MIKTSFPPILSDFHPRNVHPPRGTHPSNCLRCRRRRRRRRRRCRRRCRRRRRCRLFHPPPCVPLRLSLCLCPSYSAACR